MKRSWVTLILLVMILILNSRPCTAQNIIKNFILTTTPDWVVDTNATSNVIINSCESANYIWGRHGISPSVLWRKSKTSGDWTLVQEAGNVELVFSDGNSVIVSFYGSSGKYSIDEGRTWSPVLKMPELDPHYRVLPWCYAYHNGIFILGEYNANGRARPRLFRSIDNGATWSTIYIETNIDGINNSHIHCVTYHTALDAFIAVIGDGPNRAYLKSNSDGTNWARLMIGKGSQPIQLLDYGNPTRILCGSDTREGVTSCDLITETSYNVLSDRWTVTENSGDGECWALKKCDGIYYAFTYYEGSPKSPFAGARWPKCFVSTDGENWATYHQMPDASNTIQGVMSSISGIAQGYLHVTMYDNTSPTGSYSSYKLKQPTLVSQPGILIQSNGSNLLDSPDKAYFATANSVPTDWTNYGLNSILTSEPNGGLFGPRCIKATKPVGASGYIMVAPATSRLQYTRDGRQLYARALVKGYANVQEPVQEFCAILDTSPQSKGYGNTQTSTWTRWYLNDPLRWIEMLTASDDLGIIGSINSDCYLRLEMGNSTGNIMDASSSATVYVGGAIVSYTPIALMPDDANHPDTDFDYQSTVGNQWTSYSTIIPDVPFQTIRYFWYPWRSGTMAKLNDYCTHDSGAAGPGKVYQSTINSNTSEPPVNWREVTDANKQPHWHIKTWDDMHGNKIVLYLDCIPYYATGPNEIQGRKLKLDIYINGVKKETLEQANPFAWDRRSQWQIAVSADTAIKLFVSHSESIVPEMLTSSNSDIAVALNNGAFKNCSISHHYGDTPNMQSFTFYTVYNAGKEKASVPDTAAACKAEMDVINSTNNPIIQQQPQNLTVCKGANPTFTVIATAGCLPLRYQWKCNGSNIGTDAPVFTLPNVQLSDNGSVITCEVNNPCGSAATNPVMLTVTPLIQPQNLAICTDANATFSVGAAPGCGPIHYQWKINGSNIGMDASIFTIFDAQLSDNGSVITCKVDNSCESVTTNPVILTVTPLIAQQLQNVSVKEGATAIFTVGVAPGCYPNYYYWYKNGLLKVYGLGASVYTIPNVQASDNGSLITCRVRSIYCGDNTDAPAILTVISVVSALSGPNGRIEPNGDVSVIYGADQIFTAIPDPNYVAFQWYVDGNLTQTNNNVFTLPHICSDHIVYVTFITGTHFINASSGPGGRIEPNGDISVIHDANQVFTVVPDPNYVVYQWYVDGNLVQENYASFTLTNITYDHTVYVTFTRQTSFDEGMLLFFNSWLKANPAADIVPSNNGDGIVNFRDYAIFAKHWSENLAP
jgi:hypothetical protein